MRHWQIGFWSSDSPNKKEKETKKMNAWHGVQRKTVQQLGGTESL